MAFAQSQSMTRLHYDSSLGAYGGNGKLNIDASTGPVNLYVSGATSASGNGGIHFDKHLLTGDVPGPLKLVAQWTLPS